jgi:N-acetylneuraminic acid mutarotase
MILFPLTSDLHFSHLSSSPSPLHVTHLPSPILPPSEFATSKAWPGAGGHCAVVVGDEVFVLCGSQNFDSDYLPNEFVHRFQPSSAEWNRDTTTGDVPPDLSNACAVAIGSMIYVFGGSDGVFGGSCRRNNLRSYDTITKVWLLIKPDGKSPSGRSNSCGWSEGVFLFFFGGSCDTDDGSSLQGGEMDGDRTNQVARFNTRTDTWSNVETSGARPKPRTWAGLAKSRDKVYLMGGNHKSGGNLNDVRILDLKTFEWTELRPRGPSPGIRYDHSFTAVSPNLILLVAGYGASNYQSDVWTLNTKTQTWKREEDLPQAVVGHRAVLVQKKAYILGGSKSQNSLSDHITIFDFSR